MKFYFFENCFGLEPISAAEYLEALQSIDCKISVSYNLQPYISKKNPSCYRMQYPKRLFLILVIFKRSCQSIQTHNFNFRGKPCDINNDCSVRRSDCLHWNLYIRQLKQWLIDILQSRHSNMVETNQ